MNMWPLISGAIQHHQAHTDISASFNTLINGDYKIITSSVEYSVYTGLQVCNKTLISD